MDLVELGKLVGEYGILIVIAIIFIWYTYQDRVRNQALLEEIKEVVKTLKISNENIARTLDLLQAGCDKVSDKADRNYEAIVKKNERNDTNV